jgi:hypothetical protein
MPSKLDPHVATIRDWLAAEPQLTALTIVGRLSEKHPEQFGTKQHSIVQRLLRALRKKAARNLIAQELPEAATPAVPSMGPGTALAIEGPTRPQALPWSEHRKPRGSTDQPTSDGQHRLRHQGNIRR